MSVANSRKGTRVALSALCDKVNAEASNMSAMEKRERVQADLAALRPLDHGDMGCFEQRPAVAGKYATVTVDTVHYSVSDRLIGRPLSVNLYSERVVILYGRDKVASHARNRRPGAWVIELSHFLGTFLRKPAALGQSVALQQVHPGIRSLFLTHFRDCPRIFVEMLVFARDNSLACTDIIKAAESLSARGLKRLSADQIQAQMIFTAGHDTTDITGTDPTHDEQHSAIEESASSTLDTLSAMIVVGIPDNKLPMTQNATTHSYN